jgi:SPP1 gp7 family putative phage head morphogenesis protein
MQNDIVQDLLKLKSQLTDKRQIKAVDNRINALAYGYRINRAEAVKQSIYVAMKNAGIKEAAAGERCIASAFENGYNGVMQGIGVSFDVLPQRAIDKAIKERWHGKNYSENVWANTSKVADKASGIIQSGLTSGKSIQDMSQELKDMIGDDSEGALYNATRLIRTETGHYMNQGELEAYKDSDLEYYEYLASDPCDECGELDGRRFKVSEAVEGVNYPVMHPNCRCTTIPVVDLDEVLEEMKKGG